MQHPVVEIDAELLTAARRCAIRSAFIRGQFLALATSSVGSFDAQVTTKGVCLLQDYSDWKVLLGDAASSCEAAGQRAFYAVIVASVLCLLSLSVTLASFCVRRSESQRN